MKCSHFPRILFLSLFCVCFYNSQAQVQLNFVIDEAHGLVINAGEDTTINQGEEIVIGGATTAVGGKGDYTYEWTPATGLNDPNIANPTASPQETTNYTVKVTDEGGCSKSSQVTVTVNLTTGINENHKLDLKIYPNPTTGILQVNTDSEIKGSLLLEVQSSYGSRVYSQEIEGTNNKLEKVVDLSGYRKGIYLLILTGKDYKITRKIILY